MAADEPNNDRVEKARAAAKRGLRAFKDRTSASVERLRESEKASEFLDSGERTGRAAMHHTKRAASKIHETTGEWTDSATLAEYRSEFDAALSELVAVVIAQDAEIRSLAARLEDLKSDQTDP